MMNILASALDLEVLLRSYSSKTPSWVRRWEIWPRKEDGKQQHGVWNSQAVASTMGRNTKMEPKATITAMRAQDMKGIKSTGRHFNGFGVLSFCISQMDVAFLPLAVLFIQNQQHWRTSILLQLIL